MSRVLIVGASVMELKLLLELDAIKTSDNLYRLKYGNLDVDILITGVGVTAMTYHLTKYLNEYTVDFAILVGISGAYNSLMLGDVVNVMYERFADLGVIDEDRFTDLFEMKLKENTFPYEDKLLHNYTLINNTVINNLPIVKGNTVQSIRTKILPQIQKDSMVESMEGAAFFYVCLMNRIAFAQIRGISNYVGEQDKSRWEIVKAVNNVNAKTMEILKEIY